MKKYATMRKNCVELTYAKSKKEASEKLNVPISKVYRY